jgi:hypothetical protein
MAAFSGGSNILITNDGNSGVLAPCGLALPSLATLCLYFVAAI